MTPDAPRKYLESALTDAFIRAVTWDARDRVAKSLDQWLSFTARKRTSEDLLERLERMRKRFTVLAENFTLAYSQNRVVVKVSGDAQETWYQLTRGTDWFDPLTPDQATALVIKAVLDERI